MTVQPLNVGCNDNASTGRILETVIPTGQIVESKMGNVMSQKGFVIHIPAFLRGKKGTALLRKEAKLASRRVSRRENKKIVVIIEKE